jgi:hypothetical protein
MHTMLKSVKRVHDNIQAKWLHISQHSSRTSAFQQQLLVVELQELPQAMYLHIHKHFKSLPEFHGPNVPRPINAPAASLMCPLIFSCTRLSHCPLLATADYCTTYVTVLVPNHIARPTPQQCTLLHIRYPLHILSFCSVCVGNAH